MDNISLVLKAYYELIYELLEAKKDILQKRAEELLREELLNLGCENFDQEKYLAYRDACWAFIDERTEIYNPIGIQYTFDRIRAIEAAQLELHLNWYDSQAEFEDLLRAVQQKAETNMSDNQIRELAGELIRQFGAFPDSSIISTYLAGPALGRLPDYVVACVIEGVIK